MVRSEDCISCRFWRAMAYHPAENPNESLGHCKRRAPVATGGMMSEPTTIWPVTGEAEWCGEFEESPAIVEGDAALEAAEPPQADLTPRPHPEAVWRFGQWVGPGTHNDVRCEKCEGFGRVTTGLSDPHYAEDQECRACKGYGWFPF